jgi:hypothetical protein
MFNAVYPTFRKGESQEDAMEFFSKVRERLHEELRADLEQRIVDAGLTPEDDESWIMGKSPISDIFRGYYITKVPLPPFPLVILCWGGVDFSAHVPCVIPPATPRWKKPGNSPSQYQQPSIHTH